MNDKCWEMNDKQYTIGTCQARDTPSDTAPLLTPYDTCPVLVTNSSSTFILYNNAKKKDF